MRIVLDTNIIVSSVIGKVGPSAQVVRRLEEGSFELLLSEPLLAEYRKILRYNRLRVLHHMSDLDIDLLLENLKDLSTVIETTLRLDVIKEDPSDNRVLECAVAGGADYIASGDKDILRVREYDGIPILLPAAFLMVLDQEQDEG